jgi:Glyoxalase-like domain
VGEAGPGGVRASASMSDARRPAVAILNVVFGCPEKEPGEPDWDAAPRALAAMYGALLGMRVLREDWLVIGYGREVLPRLAFGDGPSEEYLAPRWGDPDRPAQVELEVAVDDLDAAEGIVLGLDAAPLEVRGEVRRYADPVGHPFSLFRGEVGDGHPGRLARVVFDCFSPRALAPFYQELFEMPVRVEDSAERVVVARADRDDPMPMIGLRHVRDYRPPRWPDSTYPQQIHLDVDVDDGERGIALVEELGAVRLQAMGGSCPVYADPSGHPFCLCGPGQ